MRQIIWTILCVSLGTAHTASAKSAMFNQKWQLPNEVIHFETLSSDSNITISTSTSLLKTLAINESKESRSPASWFDWVPTGAPLQAAPAECDAHLLEQRLLSLPKSNDNLFKYEIDNYFKLCGAALSLRNGHNFKALIEGVTTKYDFQDHPDIRSVRFYFKTGETNKGVLALKKDGRPHPLIVVKCGIFCDAEADATVRVVLMHLFDESPFHVLMIGNHTGTNNINSNGRVNIGGFYEGLELFSIGHWAKSKSPFKDFISEVHGVGISLGGSASLFASLYNEYNLLNQEKVFNSFIAYCPVVRLKPALDHLFGDKIRKALASQVIWQQMLSSYPYVRELQNEIDPKHRPESRRFPEILGRLALSFLSRFHPMDFVAPFQGLLIDEASDLWVANDFLKHAQEVSTPTFVWASRNDPVVEARENTESLYRYLQTSPNKAIMTYRVPYGSHCAKSVSYNWDSISTILRSYFLKHSPNFLETWKRRKITISLPQPKMDSTDIHISQEWQAFDGKNYLTLTYKTYSPYNFENNINCDFDGPYSSHKECYEYRSFKVTYNQLPIPVHRPRSKAEAQSLTRWLNAELQLLGPDGLLTGTRQSITALQWSQ